MINLEKLLVDTKSAWVEYPGKPGFEVEVVNLSRDKLGALRKRCSATKFNRSTRQAEDVLDEKKFVREFTNETVKNWKGFKLSYLEDILLVDVTGQDPNSIIDYSADNAATLVSKSSDFDSWLNEVVFDLDNFRSRPVGTNVEASGDVAK
jgi:hypothetical protein